MAHRENFVTADIDGRGRRVAMGETAQCLRRCIALPDEIDVTEADVDRLARKYLDGDVVQHAVSHIDRVVQTEQAAGVECLREKYSNMRSRPTQDWAYSPGGLGETVSSAPLPLTETNG